MDHASRHSIDTTDARQSARFVVYQCYLTSMLCIPLSKCNRFYIGWIGKLELVGTVQIAKQGVGVGE